MRSFLTLTAKACASVDTTWPQERGSKRHANAGGAQTPPDVTAASFGADCCTQSYPSTLALLSAIGKSCDSAGLNTGPAGSSGPGADQIRAGDQSQDRESAWNHDSVVTTGAG